MICWLSQSFSSVSVQALLLAAAASYLIARRLGVMARPRNKETPVV